MSLFAESAPEPCYLEQLTACLTRHRFPFAVELEFQNAVETVLLRRGWRYQREYRISTASTIDFYFPDRQIGLELKVKGSPAQVMRQLHRYALSPDISALVLLSSRARLAQMPPELAGKPIVVVSTWASGL